jgi:hypothetical protein
MIVLDTRTALVRDGTRAQIVLDRHFGEHPPTFHDLGDARFHDLGGVEVLDLDTVIRDGALGDVTLVDIEKTRDRS